MHQGIVRFVDLLLSPQSQQLCAFSCARLQPDSLNLKCINILLALKFNPRFFKAIMYLDEKNAIVLPVRGVKMLALPTKQDFLLFDFLKESIIF